MRSTIVCVSQVRPSTVHIDASFVGHIFKIPGELGKGYFQIIYSFFNKMQELNFVVSRILGFLVMLKFNFPEKENKAFELRKSLSNGKSSYREL